MLNFLCQSRVQFRYLKPETGGRIYAGARNLVPPLNKSNFAKKVSPSAGSDPARQVRAVLTENTENDLRNQLTPDFERRIASALGGWDFRILQRGELADDYGQGEVNECSLPLRA